MKWLKQNWVKILSAIVMLLGGADVASGVSQGKSLLNVSNFPGGAAALGGASVLGLSWMNRRTVLARVQRDGLDPETLEHVENIFGVASHPDVTPQMIEECAGIAAEAVRRYAKRQAELRTDTQEPRVIEVSMGTILEELQKIKEDKTCAI